MGSAVGEGVSPTGFPEQQRDPCLAQHGYTSLEKAIPMLNLQRQTAIAQCSQVDKSIPGWKHSG